MEKKSINQHHFKMLNIKSHPYFCFFPSCLPFFSSLVTKNVSVSFPISKIICTLEIIAEVLAVFREPRGDSEIYRGEKKYN